MSTSIDDPANSAPTPRPAHVPAASNESAAASTVSAPRSGGKIAHALVLDTGALIKNEPTVSTLLAQANELYTIPAVLSEIRDAETRSRVDATLRPFLTLRSPKPESIKFVTGFARKTGDLEVLSSPDIHLLALTYELECERNGGDWRLRSNPTQKQVNGKAPNAKDNGIKEGQPNPEIPAAQESEDGAGTGTGTPTSAEPQDSQEADGISPADAFAGPQVEQRLHDLTVEDRSPLPPASQASEELQDEPVEDSQVDGEDSGEDSDGWITPSNLKKHMLKDQGTSVSDQSTQRFLQAALLTTDYAMQNVALRINLNLISPSMCRINRLKTFCMRCHGCFAITKDMTKQFCPKCGQPHLIRTSCSTDENGVFRIHLKKNFQWNNRGNVYSVPKPTHGTPTGKASKAGGGGKNGWGHHLMLAEDQKEYVRATDERRRTRQRDLMDEDYLPNILSGERKGGGDRIKVGAGRSVNSRKSRR